MSWSFITNTFTGEAILVKRKMYAEATYAKQEGRAVHVFDGSGKRLFVLDGWTLEQLANAHVCCDSDSSSDEED